MSEASRATPPSATSTAAPERMKPIAAIVSRIALRSAECLAHTASSATISVSRAAAAVAASAATMPRSRCGMSAK
eukprot:6210290-Pleurochrysis_carterae.AAC.2